MDHPLVVELRAIRADMGRLMDDIKRGRLSNQAAQAELSRLAGRLDLAWRLVP